MKHALATLALAAALTGCAATTTATAPADTGPCAGQSQTECSSTLANLGYRAVEHYKTITPSPMQEESYTLLVDLSQQWQARCLIGVNDEPLTDECQGLYERFVDQVEIVAPQLVS